MVILCILPGVSENFSNISNFNHAIFTFISPKRSLNQQRLKDHSDLIGFTVMSERIHYLIIPAHSAKENIPCNSMVTVSYNRNKYSILTYNINKSTYIIQSQYKHV